MSLAFGCSQSAVSFGDLAVPCPPLAPSPGSLLPRSWWSASATQCLSRGPPLGTQPLVDIAIAYRCVEHSHPPTLRSFIVWLLSLYVGSPSGFDLAYASQWLNAEAVRRDWLQGVRLHL